MFVNHFTFILCNTSQIRSRGFVIFFTIILVLIKVSDFLFTFCSKVSFVNENRISGTMNVKEIVGGLSNRYKRTVIFQPLVKKEN